VRQSNLQHTKLADKDAIGVSVQRILSAARRYQAVSQYDVAGSALRIVAGAFLVLCATIGAASTVMSNAIDKLYFIMTTPSKVVCSDHFAPNTVSILSAIQTRPSHCVVRMKV